jgi:hypothetical protein
MERRSGAKIYLEASGIGLLRSIAGLPLEHPFDSVKSKMQTEINRKVGFLEMTKEIYKTQGVSKGLYAGFIPSAIRGAVKQVYRWPLMLVLPRVYSSMYPNSIVQKYPSITKITTGLTLAAIDAFIVWPFERLKVCLQTKKDNLSLQTFFRQNNKQLFKSLFQGLHSLFYRQMASWVSFLYTDYKFKAMAREYQGLDKNIALDNQSLFIISLLVGVANVFVVMPFDMTKTLYQQHSNEFVNKKFSETLRIVYNKTGLRGFYYGWQPRMIQYMIQSVFTVTALEKMEHKLKNNV